MKTVLITGANKSIGFASAKILANNGYHVYLGARDAAKGQEAVAKLQAEGLTNVEAKRLLFHTDQSIKEIAFALGFEDASYFNRFFKRIALTTPADYRSSIREMYH